MLPVELFWQIAFRIWAVFDTVFNLLRLPSPFLLNWMYSKNLVVCDIVTVIDDGDIVRKAIHEINNEKPLDEIFLPGNLVAKTLKTCSTRPSARTTLICQTLYFGVLL